MRYVTAQQFNAGLASGSMAEAFVELMECEGWKHISTLPVSGSSYRVSCAIEYEIEGPPSSVLPPTEEWLVRRVLDLMHADKNRELEQRALKVANTARENILRLMARRARSRALGLALGGAES